MILILATDVAGSAKLSRLRPRQRRLRLMTSYITVIRRRSVDHPFLIAAANSRIELRINGRYGAINL